MKSKLIILVILIFSAISIMSMYFFYPEKGEKQIIADSYFAVVSRLNNVGEDVTIKDLGFAYQCESHNSIKTMQNQIGYGFRILGSINKINYICKQLKMTINKRYYAGNCYCLEGVSNSKYFQKEKCQIAFNNGIITIGFPVIFGSY